MTRYNFTECVLYIGALPLLLACWGARRPWPGVRRPLLILLLAGTILAVGLDLGLVSALLPGLRQATPLRILPFLSLVGALFAARGVDRLLRGDRPGPSLIVPVLAGMALLGGLYLWVEQAGPGGFARSILEVLAWRHRGPAAAPIRRRRSKPCSSTGPS